MKRYVIAAMITLVSLVALAGPASAGTRWY